MDTNKQLEEIGSRSFHVFVGKLAEHKFAQQCLDDYFEQTSNVHYEPVKTQREELIANIYFELVCFSAYCLIIHAVKHFTIKKLFGEKFDKSSWVDVYNGVENELYAALSKMREDIMPMAVAGGKHALINYMQNLMDYDAHADLLAVMRRAKNSDDKMGFKLFSERLSTCIDPNLGETWGAFLTQWVPTAKQLFELSGEILDEVFSGK